MAHRLRADAKYFGACYTTAPAATLLLKLALEPEHWNVDWAMPASIRAVRIADLACGSGVLLQAALQTVLDNHVRAAGAQGRRPDLALVHRCLVEHVLFGLDVVPSAIHRAALALRAHQAEVNFPAMQLYTFPIGGRRHPKLGSLEFLFGRQSAVQADLLGGITGPERTTGAGTAIESLEIPRLELCVMNPPFTRSVGGNLLFGHLPKTERSKLQASLKDVVKRHQVRANITAGLGSVFAALGHQLVKPGGHLALVLPRALLSGVAWEDTRKLIGDFYAVRYIVVSHEPGAWNFSENTSLSECLVIAQRLPARVEDIPVKVVNLWRKPRASVEALAYAAAIRVADAPPLVGSIATRELKIGSSKIGEIVQASAARIARGCWNDGVAFAQTELSRTALYLTDGQLYVPSAGVVARVPVRPFGQLGTFGPDVRDVFDGFERTTTVTPYRAVWGHETGAVANMAQAPNAYLHPLVRARRGRPLRDAALLWSRAGRLLIAERFRLNTVRVLSVRSEH
ncbi:MAG: hypothetical protein HY654_06445, partial [Acidobacteria bacterium]|nr:hypothetical protein [Acidobacteriota bacterium]